MPISKREREEKLSQLLKTEADAIETIIEAFIEKHYRTERTKPFIEVSFTSVEPVRLAIRDEIVKRYRKAGYTVNDYTDNQDPNAKFRIGFG